MDNLDNIFCDVDNFCRELIPQWEQHQLADGSRKRQRHSRMTTSEIMTIIIYFHTSHYRNFKNYYLGYISRFYKDAFSDLLSYTRFLEVIPKALVPLTSYFTTLKGEPTGIEFIDSTSIKVCHNLRIPQHKTLKGIAERGKGTMGWFYGFKLHIITNFKGEIVATQLTTGNVHDTKPISALAAELNGKLYADKGYISKKLKSELYEKGVDLVTNVRKNMKAKDLSLWDRAMLSRRFIIETINDQLKNISQHRSSHGFMLNLMCGLVAYCLKDNKPILNISDLEMNTILKA